MASTLKARTVALVAVVGCGTLLIGCGSATSSQPAGPSASVAPASASPSRTAGASSASPEPNGSDPIDFELDGSIGGQALAGKLRNGTFSIPCAGGGDQILSVHWIGDAGSARLQGEIDFKPGTWTIGSDAAQGSATLGLLGGKAADNLVATAGSVTTEAGAGSIDAAFSNGPDTVHLSGSWTCPPG